MRPRCVLAAVEDLVHFIGSVAVEHREDVVGGVVAQSVVLVKLIGLGLGLRKERLCWLIRRVASLLGLLLEPAHELGQLYVRLKTTHRVQEYHQHVLDQRRRGR